MRKSSAAKSAQVAQKSRAAKPAAERMCDCGKTVAECIKSPGAAHKYLPPSMLASMTAGVVIVDVRPGETEEAARARVAKQIASKEGPAPCEFCGKKYTRENGSRLSDGTWVHVPCPKRTAAIKKEREAAERTAKVRPAPPPRPAPPAKAKPARSRREPERDFGHVRPFVSHCDLGMMIRAVRSGSWHGLPEGGGGQVYLQLHRGTRNVLFTKMDSTGLGTSEMSIEKFERSLRPLKTRDGGDYPVASACESFKKIALKYGATQGVLNHLAQVVQFTEEEIAMATAKQQAKSAAGGSGKAAKGPKQKGSGERIREMIMENKKSTEEILTVIHKEFPGSKAKSSDVSWNRGWLIKHGQKPPAPKGRTPAAPAKGGKGKPAKAAPKGKAKRAA